MYDNPDNLAFASGQILQSGGPVDSHSDYGLRQTAAVAMGPSPAIYSTGQQEAAALEQPLSFSGNTLHLASPDMQYGANMYPLPAAPGQSFLRLPGTGAAQAYPSVYNNVPSAAQAPGTATHLYVPRANAIGLQAATSVPTQPNSILYTGAAAQQQVSSPAPLRSQPLDLDSRLNPFQLVLQLSCNYDAKLWEADWEYVDSNTGAQEKCTATKLLNLLESGRLGEATLVRTAGSYWTLLKLVEDTLKQLAVLQSKDKESAMQENPAGRGGLASVNQAVQLFSAGQPAGQEPLWWYIDNNRKVQGPYPASKLIDWYCAGYFSLDMQMVGVAVKGNHTFPPPRSFFRPLRILFQIVRSGVAYVPVKEADLAQGRPPAGWNEVQGTHHTSLRQGVDDGKGRGGVVRERALGGPIQGDRDSSKRYENEGPRPRGGRGGRGVVQGWGGLPVGMDLSAKLSGPPSTCESASDILSSGDFSNIASTGDGSATTSHTKAAVAFVASQDNENPERSDAPGADMKVDTSKQPEGEADAAAKQGRGEILGWGGQNIGVVPKSPVTTPSKAASAVFGSNFWGGQAEVVKWATVQPTGEDASFDVTAFASAAAVRALHTSLGLPSAPKLKSDNAPYASSVVLDSATDLTEEVARCAGAQVLESSEGVQ